MKFNITTLKRYLNSLNKLDSNTKFVSGLLLSDPL